MRLSDGSGAVSYAVWTPHRPGNVILGRMALPLILVFGAIVLASALVSRHVVRSAKRLLVLMDISMPRSPSASNQWANARRSSR